MKKIYHLGSCSTCVRILNELDLPEDVILQDIKKEPLSAEQLLEMKQLAGSYEKLFSKRAQLYKQRNLKEQQLVENDFRDLILEHYTFLSRPVIINDGKIFIGNSKNTIEEAKDAFEK